MNLPKQRYKGPHNDDQWIIEQVNKLPFAWRAGAIRKYSTVFSGNGRAAANTWLREGVKKFGGRS